MCNFKESLRRFFDAPVAGISRREWLLWLLLALLFLIVGTVGHDPWGKRGEAYTFGVIYNFFTSHTWLIPTDAGIPFMEKPPLYAWTAAILCKLLHIFLHVPDAARLASLLYTIITVVFLWRTAKILFRDHMQRESLPWISVLLFLGTYGVARWTHEMITDVPLCAGSIITVYGLAVLSKAREKRPSAALWLGLGLGISFMSKGLFLPAVLGISCLIAWWWLPALRHPQTLKTALWAALVASPFLIIWPALLYLESPYYFMQWFWDNNVGRFLGFSVEQLGARNDRPHLLAILPLFSFPVLPLVLAEIFLARKHWRTPEFFVPFIVAVIGLTLLFLSATGRPPYILPLMPELALLAACALTRLPPRASACWNGLARIGFTLTTAGLWLIWWNLRQPPDHRPIPWLVKRFDDTYPADFVVDYAQPFACAVAITAALFWLVSLRTRGDSPLSIARIWFTGFACLWCTTFSLLMPWLNEAHSYRTAVEEMQDFLRNSRYANECIGNVDLGENMGPMVEYFLGRSTPLPAVSISRNTCNLFLTFTDKQAPVEMDPHWQMVWHGTRLRDIKTYELRMYARKTVVN